ncbi:MAG: methionyl-tRNA formyltransferase [Rhodoferax sp.]
MRLVFAGTPEFARVALQRLCEAGHEVVLVLTQPDRPAGRGMQLQASPVKQWALAHGLPVAQPRGLRLDGRFAEDAAQARDALAQVQADAMVVAAYGLILPGWVLDAMRAGGGGLGCLNIHASLLPRWRGAAPIHRAIEAGDPETGVTIMQMDEGLDTGDMLLTGRCPIRHEGPDADTTETLHDRLAALGAALIVQALAAPPALKAQPQPAQGVTYAAKIDKAQARLRWEADAALLARQVRAFQPAPGAWSALGADTLKVWRAHALPDNAPAGTAPGTVLLAGPAGIEIACGQGRLCITELQKAGGKRLDAAAFLRGFALQPGARLGVPGTA